MRQIMAAASLAISILVGLSEQTTHRRAADSAKMPQAVNRPERRERRITCFIQLL
jgi:hypothetical protein